MKNSVYMPLSSLLSAILLLLVNITGTVQAAEFGRTEFQQRWQRVDYPVQQGRSNHSWVWGPAPISGVLQEYYIDSPGQRRMVQYLDKSRMEINSPGSDTASEWYVTNGLLTEEMITGQIQVGDQSYITYYPSDLPVVGDFDNSFPRYLDLRRIYDKPSGLKQGQNVTNLFASDGTSEFTSYANNPNTRIVQLEHNFGIPRAFWTFMNQGGNIYANGAYSFAQPLFNWLYVIGNPISDPYWVKVKVGGEQKDVLFQAFERRVLTYTPSNPAQFQVEMGNEGSHYYAWRYTMPFPNGKQAYITRPGNLTSTTVSSPLVVQGFEKGQAFEARVTVRLISRDGHVIAEQPTTVYRPDVNMAGPFQATLTYNQPQNDMEGYLQVVVTSPQNGEAQVILSNPVTISRSQ